MAQSGFYIPERNRSLLTQTAIVEINAKLDVLTEAMIELHSTLFSVGREDIKKRFDDRLGRYEVEELANLVQKFGEISSEGG